MQATQPKPLPAAVVTDPLLCLCRSGRSRVSVPSELHGPRSAVVADTAVACQASMGGCPSLPRPTPVSRDRRYSEARSRESQRMRMGPVSVHCRKGT